MNVNHVLLLGEGFSRNWGGWLAKDVNEYLMTCREIQENGVIKDAFKGIETAVASKPR